MNKGLSIKFFVFSLVLLLLIAFVVCGLSEEITVSYYQIDSDKINNPIRIVQISDIHSCYYGENQSEIIEAVRNEHPDIVVLTGDIFDDDLDEINSEVMIARLSKYYPLLYVSGNHEAWSDKTKSNRQREILERYGVIVLNSESYDIVVNGETIRFMGIADQAYSLKLEDTNEVNQRIVANQFSELYDDVNEDMFEILLAHRPEFIEQYSKLPFDLVLSGHTHGGVVRIPYLINGVYAWGQGLFPKWSGGLYSINEQTTLIISRGLSRESSGRRFYNRPELVVIDVV